MWSLIVKLGVIGLLVSWGSFVDADSCELAARGGSKFPENFSFGVSTSAYQVEGAWNTDGKGSSIWDEFTHNHPEAIADRTNGDVAEDSYHLFNLDLQALKELKVNHYRFSIAWTRVFPTGDISSRNQVGIDYYNSIIDQLLANGIEPMITMYHWDLPVEIQKQGGFLNDVIVQKFVAYAEELFKLYGGRVKKWITFNEPMQVCKPGYGTGELAPQVHSPGVGDYLCFTNTLKAHALTYHLYRNKYQQSQGGKIGITLNSYFAYSKTNNQDDVNRAMQFMLGIMAHPIFSKAGGFPQVLVDDIARNSQNEGRSESRLPYLDKYWTDLIRGSADFLGLNYYSSSFVQRAPYPIGENPSMQRDSGIEEFADPSWLPAKSFWLFCVPQGLEDLLRFVRDEYDNVEVMITENGWSDDGQLDDDNRVRYYKSHLQAILNAIHDGSKVTSYSAWSLIDNFEWQMGYTEKFGLYAVNMNSPNREHTPKKSAFYYKNVIQAREVL